MPEIVDRCPLCGSTRQALLDRRTFHGQLVENQLCRNCGFVFLSPRMTAAEAGEYYAAEYRRMYQKDEGPSRKDLEIQRRRADWLAAFLRPQVTAVKGHLDIGASAGLLLEMVRKSYGCESTGVEPGDAYRRYAQANGLRMVATLDELRAGRPDRFDLVSMSHVLEHMPDPLATLSMLRAELLTPDGWLLVEVPNLYAHDSFEVAHLASFSQHTLGQALARAGFRIIRLQAHGRPRSTVLPLYLTALACPEDGSARPVTPERGVALKRRLGLLRRAFLERLLPGRAWLPLPE